MNVKANEFVMAGALALTEELASLREALNAVRQQRDAALAELATARRQRDAAVAALEAVVTEGIQHKGFRECWFCHAWLPEHKPDCEGQAALAQARGQ